jgi:hypothetical protein
VKHTLWRGKHNTAAFELHENGANLNADRYTAITRIVIDLKPAHGGTTVSLDSEDNQNLFQWGGSERKVTLFGRALPTAAAVGVYFGRVTLYAPDYPDGIVFVDFDQYDVTIRI